MATELLHWSLNSNTSITDDSGNSNDGTITGTLTQVTGKFGNAINVGDSTAANYITCANSLTCSGAVSMSCWFEDSTWNFASGYYTFFDLYIPTKGDNRLYAYDTSSTTSALGYETATASTNIPTGTTMPVDSTWHHVVYMTSGTATQIYLDNVSIVNDTTNFYSPTLAGTFTVGIKNGPYDQLQGSVDEVWVFDGTLTTTEISNLYNYNSLTAGGTYTLTAANGAYSEAGQVVNLNPIRGVKMGYGLKVSL